jgi:hypothetical protein
VSAAQSPIAIDIGAIDQGSAAARRRNESAAARSRAADIEGIVGHEEGGVKRGPVPRARAALTRLLELGETRVDCGTASDKRPT